MPRPYNIIIAIAITIIAITIIIIAIIIIAIIIIALHHHPSSPSRSRPE